jgi:hypothetical protein
MTRPTVSAIMATMPTRRHFWPLAIEAAHAQTPELSEIVIAMGPDDACHEDEIRSHVSDTRLALRFILAADAGWRSKYNAAMQAAKGTHAVLWEDDDYHAPHRVGALLAACEKTGARLVGQRSMLVVTRGGGPILRCTIPAGERRVCHGTILGERRVWLESPYTEESDSMWQSALRPVAVEDVGRNMRPIKSEVTPDHGDWESWHGTTEPTYVAIHHGGNTWQTDYTGPAWGRIEEGVVTARLRDELDAYAIAAQHSVS